MTVSSILRRKGTHVETVHAKTSAAEVAERLTKQGVGSLVVLDAAQRVIGVVAERDLVRALAEHGASAEYLSVTAIMVAHPITCAPGDSLEHVMSAMTRRKARHLPVMAGEALVGVVSIGDVVKSQLDNLRLEVGVLSDFARMRSGGSTSARFA